MKKQTSEKISSWSTSRGIGLEHLKAILTKPIPRNVSWLHTLGSLLIVYILFQTLTGILLALYYSPSPDHAYKSIKYIREQLFLGRLLHHLHRYGSGFVIVTAFLHMARSYFLAAYKPPREALWLTGLLLGILLTLFAFTGQLLPYDQRGYWATVVGIEIASSAPVVGDSVREVLTGGYGDIGATTLSRFYIVHVCVLPLVFFSLLGFHLFILQRVGPAGPVSGSPDPQRPFYPYQVIKDVLVAAAGAFVLFLVAALVVSVEMGPADPSPSDYVPRPEWYLLAHFEILKYLPGKYSVIGTFVLPNALVAALVLLPFLDRTPERSLRKRRISVAVGALGCIAVVGLTAKGVAELPEREIAGETAHDPVSWGKELYHEKKCTTCHALGGEGGDKGPPHDDIGRRLQVEYMREWIRRPQAFDPTTEMPAFKGTEEELEAIVLFLSTLK